MSTSKSRVGYEFEHVRDDLVALRSDISDLAAAIARDGGRKVRDAGRSAGRLAEAGLNGVKGAAKDAAAKVESVAEDAEAMAREKMVEHPWITAFGALGIGLLVGRFLDRR